MEANEENLALVAQLLDEAREAGLDGYAQANAKGLAWCTERYNGCGPECLRPRARAKLTSYLALFAPAFMLHDCDFAESDGKMASFHAANERLRVNCLKLADRAYAWWNWKRYRARLAADLIADLCDSIFGFYSWEEAHMQRTQYNKENQ